VFPVHLGHVHVTERLQVSGALFGVPSFVDEVQLLLERVDHLLEHPSEAEIRVHQPHHFEQELDGGDVAQEAPLQVYVLHFDGDLVAFQSLGFVDLRQTRRGYGGGVERLEDLVGVLAEVLHEQLDQLIGVSRQALVLEGFERLDVLSGQDVAHRDQTLPHLDVGPAVGQTPFEDAIGGPLVDATHHDVVVGGALRQPLHGHVIVDGDENSDFERTESSVSRVRRRPF
jgi:hypothetical protein